MIQSKMSIMNLIRHNYLSIYYVTMIHVLTNIKHDETNTNTTRVVGARETRGRVPTQTIKILVSFVLGLVMLTPFRYSLK